MKRKEKYFYEKKRSFEKKSEWVVIVHSQSLN